MKRITNGAIFRDNKWLDDMDLLLDGSKIVDIIDRDAKYDAQVIDASGGYICPGFINLHIHGAEGYDTMDGTKEAIEALAKFSARHGTTSFLPTTMTSSIENTRKSLEAIKKVKETGCIGAQILGVHLEGPFINRKYKGAQYEQYIQKPSIDNYLQLTDGFEDIITMITLAPEIDGAKSFIKYLRSRGVYISAGHTRADYDTGMASFEWGISHITHCYNAMTPLHHRDPGIIGAAFDRQDVTVELISDLIHIHPAVLRLTHKLKGANHIALVTDSMAATNLNDGKYMLGANEVWVKHGIAKIAEGNLAGSTLTHDQALRNMVRIGTTLEDAITMLSTTPAQIIGVGSDKGKIEKGYDADIVILNKNLQIGRVMVLGKSI